MIIPIEEIKELISKGSREDYLEYIRQFNPTVDDYLKKQKEEEYHRHLLDEASKLHF